MSMTDHTCPRCGIDMFAGGTPDVHMLGCNKCCGLFMDNRGCARLVSGTLPDAVREQIRNTTLHAPNTTRATGYRERATGSDRSCPICGEALAQFHCTRRTHGADVHIDVCSEHGTWFDQGEAWALLQAVDLKKMAALVEQRRRRQAEEANESTEAWSQFLELFV